VLLRRLYRLVSSGYSYTSSGVRCAQQMAVFVGPVFTLRRNTPSARGGDHLVLLAKLATLEYSCGMRTVNIGELKNQLSGYLQFVRNGEEIVIRDRSVPVARILPFLHGSGWEQEVQLVASGAMKTPEEEMDWELLRTPGRSFVPSLTSVRTHFAI
jgi:prevent-host-death family protein